LSETGRLACLLFSAAFGSRPRLSAFDWWLRLLERASRIGSEWGAALNLLLVVLGVAFLGRPLVLVMRSQLALLTLMLCRSFRDTLIRATTTLAAGHAEARVIDKEPPRALCASLVASKLQTGFQLVGRALFTMCAAAISAAWGLLQLLLLFLPPAMALGASVVAVEWLVEHEDQPSTTLLLPLSACWAVYSHLVRRWITPLAAHDRESSSAWRLVVHVIIIIAAVAASAATAMVAPALARVGYSWSLHRRLSQGSQVAQLALPLLSANTLTSMQAQARRSTEQFARKLTRHRVASRPVEANEICAICHDNLVDDDSAPKAPIGLAHCKWGCGRAVHAACMEGWRKHSACASCVFCGADW